jgi:hypothetical protein
MPRFRGPVPGHCYCDRSEWRPERLELPAFWFVGTQYKTLSVAYGLGFELVSERSVVAGSPCIANQIGIILE